MSEITRNVRKTSSVKMPKRDSEEQRDEYWHEHKGITECPECGNVHFKKRWYQSMEDIGHLRIEKMEIAEKKLCPACHMIKNRLFEGELFAEGFPLHHQDELMNLIFNFGERARKKDPQDRIINVEKTLKGYRVTTTENQLADKLGKKIKDAFNTVKVHFSHAAEPAEVDRVHATFYEA